MATSYTYEVPDESNFLATLVKLLHDTGNEMADWLSQGELHIDTSSNFSNRWNAYWADVSIYLPHHFYSKISDSHKDDLLNLTKKIMPKSTGYDIQKLEIYPKIEDGLAEEKSIEAHFEQQQQKIIDSIREAKFTIWVAVAWFTDPELINELLAKKKEGLNIRIVVSDDDINQKSVEKLEQHFEVKKYPRTGYYQNNIMHNKFCVIDFQVVVHGSYNWSKKAQYNKETVMVNKDRKIAENFGEEFIKLMKE
ncbi:MAG: DUF1669 domain-containing protein [Bacteroidia bacterium]|nr:DUF1669 domain-containing protein [Bacteroidia bacterium]